MRRLPILLALGAACVLLGAPSAATAPRTTTGSQCMVIWSVYRSGGSYSGGPVATYDRQYLNLLNRCSTTVNLTGVLFDWWAQGPSYPGGGIATCTPSGPPDPYACMLPGGHYWLISYPLSAGAGVPLPVTPDHTVGSFTLPGQTQGGTIIYLLGTHSGNACPSSVLDAVGFAWPSSPCAEGTQAATPSATTALTRVPPCKDTDNNSADFQAIVPAPLNSNAFVTPTANNNCVNGGMTLATLASASATRTSRGVLVRWRTGTELGILGYNVYRQVAGKLVRANRSLRPGAFHASAGAAHSFLDRSAPKGRAVYRIQAVGTNGGRTWVTTVVAR
jgi:hypothetical protein